MKHWPTTKRFWQKIRRMWSRWLAKAKLSRNKAIVEPARKSCERLYRLLPIRKKKSGFRQNCGRSASGRCSKQEGGKTEFGTPNGEPVNGRPLLADPPGASIPSAP